MLTLLSVLKSSFFETNQLRGYDCYGIYSTKIAKIDIPFTFENSREGKHRSKKPIISNQSNLFMTVHNFITHKR